MEQFLGSERIIIAKGENCFKRKIFTDLTKKHIKIRTIGTKII